MEGFGLYLIYAAVIVAIILMVEGTYMLVRGLVGGGRDVNRRLQLIRKTNNPAGALSLIHRTEDAGPVNRAVDRVLPALKQALWTARVPLTTFQAVIIASLACLLVAGLLSLRGMPPLIALVCGAGVGYGAPLLALQVRADTRRRKFLDQFPQAIDLVARGLQVGHPIPVAMGAVAQQMADPIGTEFGLAVDEITYGVDREQAMRNMAERFPAAELTMFVASVQIARETGGNLAEVFLKLADVLRAKAQLRKKVWAVSAEGRLSTIIIASLPFAVGGALLFLSGNYYREVQNDPLFWRVLSVPPVLMIIGVVTMWRLVNFKF